MATRNNVMEDVSPTARGRLVTWAGLLNGDDGAYLEWVDFADRCIQVAGVFGTGGSVSVQGSNDGVNWVILADPQGNPLTFTSGRIEQVLELPRYVRPLVTAGDGTTNLTVTLCMRKVM